MKFTLIGEQDSFKTTQEFDEYSLPTVLENITVFLRGCGYHFDGSLEIVDYKGECTSE
jgi:hypothetical protein